ncbi:fimbrial protein [Enterobacter asburiae]|uniref:fimbrial protein n=1 Tax=Enterobacter asburiae TaxID=61645 RepID=UPI003F440B51
MKKIHNLWLLLVSLVGGGLFSVNSMAACTPSAPYSATISLTAGDFSAGEDMSTGSLIRMQRVNGFRDNYVPCTGAPRLTYLAMGGVSYPGLANTYQTGVGGLGVRFKNTATNIYFGSGNAASFSGTILSARFSVDVEFVKVGPLSAGSVSTAGFPVISIVANDPTGGTPVATYSFAGGTFRVTTPTCTTPNYTFDIGSPVVTDFSAGNPASPWVDTVVILTNCPVFYGNNSNGSYASYTITGTGATGQSIETGSLAPNIIQMRLTPNTTVIDTVNGIISLDSASDAAGVSVQIGNKQSGSYIPQNLSNPVSVNTTPGANTTTVSFPLGARMIKTDAPVRAGRVSASVTYTIGYQ